MPEQSSPEPLHRGLVVAVCLVLLLGVVARILIVTGALGEPNADEAVPGLMAMHLLDGEWSTFYWGQAYAGTLDVILLAPFVALFGNTRAALAVVPFMQGAVVAWLVWAITRRILGRSAAITAATLVWVFPASFVWWQTRQGVIYLPVIILGLTAVLCALRLVLEPDRRLDWFLLGLAFGLGFWTSPHIAYFALPITIWLLVRLGRTALRSGWPSVAGALIGASPWLAANVFRGWPSLIAPPVSDGPWGRLVALFGRGLPMSLGLRLPFDDQWIVEGLGLLLYLVGLGAVIVASTVRRPRIDLHIWLLCAFPVLFALIPAPAYVGSGRYFIFLAPPIAIALTSLARRPWAQLGLIVVAVALTGFSLFQIRDLGVSGVPPTEPLIDVLESEGLDHVVAGYWVANKVTWETGERIVASPIVVNRYPLYLEEISQADKIAYVYNLTKDAEVANAEALRSALEERGLAYDEHAAGQYTIIVPEVTFVPSELPAEAVPLP